MGAAYFYHLTRRPVSEALPQLLTRALDQGWRVAVRGTDASRLDRLDQELWLVGGGESFLPHGRARGRHDADQPILLTESTDNRNGAVCVMSVDGAEVSPEEVGTLERVCILFEGDDPAAVERARSQWRAITGSGAAAQYWSEASGRWEKKAEA